MPHETTLIATIVMGLVIAFGFGFLAHRLKLSPLVGYLLAGIAVGPFTPGFVADNGLAGQLAEIGVILLMFGVGLHFSIRDLIAVRNIALPGAVVQIGVATAIGVGIAALWGWGLGAGLVFGLALSVASTVVLLRALEERHAVDTQEGRIAVGWLIVEDLAMVLALVLLPALAPSLGGSGQSLAGALGGDNLALTLALTVGKVVLFVVLVLVVGRRVVPWLLAQVARTGSRELFTLSVLAVALGIAFGSAVLFDVSFALGAFFAGVVLSESDLSHEAAAKTLPFQDAFAVLFFVSVGMLFDPSILVREPLAVLAVVLTIVLGKSIAAFAIVLAFRYPLKAALTISASLAQIGEFSFILVGLGVTLNLLPAEGRDLVLAGALLSITLNPLCFAGIDPLERWVRRRPRLAAIFDRPEANPPAAADPKAAGLRGHAILVGYGRVGSFVGRTLIKEGLPFVVIEQNRIRLEELRAEGIAAVYGNATDETILEAAGVRDARLMIAATPDGMMAGQMIAAARRLNPEIDTVVRSHSEAQLAYLERQGAGLVVMGERELALGMIGFTLRSLGFSEDRAKLVVQSARTGETLDPPEDAPVAA